MKSNNKLLQLSLVCCLASAALATSSTVFAQAADTAGACLGIETATNKVACGATPTCPAGFRKVSCWTPSGYMCKCWRGL